MSESDQTTTDAEEYEKAKAFAAERHAALEALGDLGLTDESYWSGGEATVS